MFNKNWKNEKLKDFVFGGLVLDFFTPFYWTFPQMCYILI